MARSKQRVGLPRRYAFKLYPSRAQATALGAQAQLCAELWNALLQRQKDLYRRTRGQRGVVHREGKSLRTFFDLTSEITALRHACPEWREMSVWTAHRVAEALGKAFDGFFRRAKAGSGAEAGYPRYKPTRLAAAVPHRFASGCKLAPMVREGSDAPGNPASARSWRLTLKGVPGAIRARGEFPAVPIAWTHADVIFRDGAWWLSACVDMPVRREAGADHLTITFDLIDEFARVERADDPTPGSRESARAPAQKAPDLNGLAGWPSRPAEMLGDDGGNAAQAGPFIAGILRPAETPGAYGGGLSDASVSAAANSHPAETPHQHTEAVTALAERADAIKSARDTRNFRGPCSPGGRRQKPSWRWLRETQRAQALTGKAARIRREFLHGWSTTLVRSASGLTIVRPPIKAATASPRGDARSWGARVGDVSPLNRHVLAQGPAMAIQMLAYKAAEAGVPCQILDDAAPPVAIGRDLVATGKTARRARRAIKETSA